MYTQSYVNCFVDLHSKNVPVGMYPIIIIDMWQHAYYKDYLGDSKTYLIAMMKQLRWPIIEKRFEKADKIMKILEKLFPEIHIPLDYINNYTFFLNAFYCLWSKFLNYLLCR